MSIRQLIRIGLGKLVAGLFIAAITACALAQQSATQTDGPTMKDVNDVLGGQATILQQDDAGLLVVTQPVGDNPNLNSQILPLDSSNSILTPQTPVSLGSSYGITNFYTPNSIATSSASGRMFNNSNDVVVGLTTAPNSNTLQQAWFYTYWNPATGSNQKYLLNSQLIPNAPQIASKVI